MTLRNTEKYSFQKVIPQKNEGEGLMVGFDVRFGFDNIFFRFSNTNAPSGTA